MGCSHRRWDWRSAVLSLSASLALAGCSGGGNDGAAGPVGPPGPVGPGGVPVVIGAYDPLPGVNATIVGVTGGSGVGGALQSGDFLTVRFTVQTNDAAPLDLAKMAHGEIYLSGPSNNYQVVLAPQYDVATHSINEGGGVWSYTFVTPVPALYPAPFNDTASFGLADGELQGTALLDGTYTVGLSMTWPYTSDGESLLDTGAATYDTLFGAAPTISHREVVANQNCDVCHTEVRIHGGYRKDVRTCVLCHTAGSEDGNTAGATPGVTIEFKVMIHKIHAGSRLPSVLGMSTDASGNRLYPTGPAGSSSTTVVNLPKPLLYSGYMGSVSDFSTVIFPLFPNFNVSLPKDQGYSALGSATPVVPVGYTGPTIRTQKSCEDNNLRGPTACAKCHGDPDAGGPLAAPAEGDLCYTQPSAQACGSCHDDIDWNKPYIKNGATMPAQPVNGACLVCHSATGGSLPTKESHVHPLNNSAIDAGVNSVITAVTGGTGPLGQFQNGDAPVISFTLKNDAGANIALAALDQATTFFFGPNQNRQPVMPLTSGTGYQVSPYDFVGRLQAVSSTGKGTMGKVFQGTPVVAETLVVEFTSTTSFAVGGTTSGFLGTGTLAAATSSLPSGASVANWDLSGITATEQLTIAFSSATAFTVTGSSSGALGAGTLPATVSGSTRFTSPKVSFNVAVGTTAFTGGTQINAVLFKGGGANPVTFAIVAGSTAFSATAGAPDRFYYEVVPSAATYTLNVPVDMQTEFLGDGNGLAGQTFTAGNLPVYYGRQQLWTATAAAPTGTTAAAVLQLARQVDLAAPITGFASGDLVVVEPTGGVGVREYTTITPMKADGTTATNVQPTVRIYFQRPLRYGHGVGVTISKVTLAFKQEGAANAYTLNGSTGVVTLVSAIPLGTPIVMTYRSYARFGYFRHFGDVRQTYYAPPANSKSSMGQPWGDWGGLSYLSGTYTADIWFARNLDVALYNELQTYRSTSTAGTKDFLYGTATTIEPRAVIASNANCYACHDDVLFHGGGRRGVDACLTCHGIAAESTSLLPNTGLAFEFRWLLHEVHEGVFPPMPGGVKQCVRCHGNDAWTQPTPRSHPSATAPVRIWNVPCSSCHTSVAAQAHFDINTPGGTESCDVCHGPSSPWTSSGSTWLASPEAVSRAPGGARETRTARFRHLVRSDSHGNEATGSAGSRGGAFGVRAASARGVRRWRRQRRAGRSRRSRGSRGSRRSRVDRALRPAPGRERGDRRVQRRVGLRGRAARRGLPDGALHGADERRDAARRLEPDAGVDLPLGPVEQLPAGAAAAVRRGGPFRLRGLRGLVLHLPGADPGALSGSAQRHGVVRAGGRRAQGHRAPRRHVHGRARTAVGLHVRGGDAA